MKKIKCRVGELDDIREQFGELSHFTVRNGKAKYHLLHLPDNSCGLYYALRATDMGFEGRRALEPTDEIICWGK